MSHSLGLLFLGEMAHLDTTVTQLIDWSARMRGEGAIGPKLQARLRERTSLEYRGSVELIESLDAAAEGMRRILKLTLIEMGVFLESLPALAEAAAAANAAHASGKTIAEEGPEDPPPAPPPGEDADKELSRTGDNLRGSSSRSSLLARRATQGNSSRDLLARVAPRPLDRRESLAQLVTRRGARRLDSVGEAIVTASSIAEMLLRAPEDASAVGSPSAPDTPHSGVGSAPSPLTRQTSAESGTGSTGGVWLGAQATSSWARLKANRELFRQETRRIFSFLDTVMTHYIFSALCHMFTIALAEVLADEVRYAAQSVLLQDLAADFIRSALPLFERALAFDPELFRSNLFHKSTKGLSKDPIRMGFVRVVHKARLLDVIFASMDVYIFPFSIECHGAGVKRIVLSRVEPSLFLTAGYDRLLRIHHSRTRFCHGQFAGHASIVTACAFSSDDDFFVSASCDHTLRRWDSRNAELLHVYRGHQDAVTDCDLSPDDRLLCSASMDRTVRLWAVASGDCLRLLKGHSHWVKGCRFVSSAHAATTPAPLTTTRILSAGLDKSLMLWSLNPSQPAPEATWAIHEDYICDFAVHGHLALTCSRDCTVKLTEWATGKVLHTLQGLPGQMSSVAFSADGAYFITSSFDNHVCVFRTHDVALQRHLSVHNQGILCSRFSETERTIYIGTVSGVVQSINL
jgi:WD40 repeat protein